MAWQPPEFCDLCVHPIAEHSLWEPDVIERGWMVCVAPNCMKCWHGWYSLSEPQPGQLIEPN